MLRYMDHVTLVTCEPVKPVETGVWNNVHRPHHGVVKLVSVDNLFILTSYPRETIQDEGCVHYVEWLLCGL